MMVAIYCYLERENDKAFKFHINNYYYFEISASLYYSPPFNKHCTSKLQSFKIPLQHFKIETI